MIARDLGYLSLGLLLVFGGLWLLAPVWGALLLSVLLYLLLQPAVVRLQTRGWSPTNAILLTLGLPLLALGVLGFYLTLELANYLPRLSEDLTRLQNGVASVLYSFETRLDKITGVHLRLSEYSRNLDMSSWLNTEQLISSSGWLFSIAINVLLTPMLAFFLIRDYRAFRDRLMTLLPNHRVELGWLMYRRISSRLRQYLRALFLQATILATITAIGFAIAGFPSAILLGVLTGIAGLVPYLGPFLAMIPPFLVLMTTPGFDPERLGHAALVLLTGFGFDNLVVIPFLVAGTVNLHPALALVAVLVAGHVAGIAGMVIVIPLLGVIGIIGRTLLEGLKTREPGEEQRLPVTAGQARHL